MDLGAGGVRGIEFHRRELVDLGLAWGALGVAFTVFFIGGGERVVGLLETGALRLLGVALGVSLATAGTAVVLHELAHKLAAVRYGKIAHFRADYGMLLITVMLSLGGIIFAAPGAVYHRGAATERQNAMIALAGPVSNLALAVLFAPFVLLGAETSVVGLIGGRGVAINLILAAFNLVPYGPLDGKTVAGWSKGVWLAAFALAAGLTVVVVFVFGIGLERVV